MRAKYWPMVALCLVASPGVSRGQVVDANAKCSGVAVVRPPGGLYGSIYLSDRKERDGSFVRAGYLPSGVAVLLDSPPTDAPDSIKKAYCAFSYRQAMGGMLARRHIVPVEPLALAAGLKLEDIRGFVAPANPEPDGRLKLYGTTKLADDEVVAEFGRNDLAVIFLLEQLTEDDAPLKVAYLANPAQGSPRILIAYLRPDENRCCSADGTYRIFKPRVNAAKPSPPPGADTTVRAYLTAIFDASAEKIRQLFDEKAAQILSLKGCRGSAEFTLKISLKAGLETSLLTITPAGEGKVKWSKPDGEVEQFVTVGRRDDLRLTIHGIAECSVATPNYLKEAHIVIGKGGTRGFNIDRDGFFERLDDNASLKSLKKKSGNINVASSRAMSQLFVVPKIRGEQSVFYFTLFDEFERYMSAGVFGPASLTVDKDDEFAILLMLAETVSYWERRN